MRALIVSISLIFGVLGLQFASAQIFEPVKWEAKLTDKGDGILEFTASASIDEGWHLYSQFLLNDDGPVRTSFGFDNESAITWIDDIFKETPEAIEAFDKTFAMDVAWHENTVVFSRQLKVTGAIDKIEGFVEYMVCDKERCLPPTKESFTLEIPSSYLENVGAVAGDAAEQTPQTTDIEEEDLSSDAIFSLGLWSIFIAGFLGGLAALLMPCIFPMLPLTVSYFTKQSEKRSNSVFQAILYGLSIIVIYTGIGLLITITFGSNALNKWSSSGVFNLFFFALLILFAISFLGGFELTLPHSWANFMDKKADSKGLLGLFFMAFALVLVSFSCTGPIIGTLLVQAVSSGSVLGPAMGMFGFSLALALPFTLFALFPSGLKSLPKSGGWLNKVKVTLGFLELAFALKFLSNVDLAYHWNFLDRDLYLVAWVAIFFVQGFYLLGFFKMPGDRTYSDKPQENVVSIFQLFVAVFTFMFAFYLLPGMWGAPLKGISGWLPPMQTQDYVVTSMGGSHGLVLSDQERMKKKNDDIFHAPHGIDAFFDYDEALEASKKFNKPVFLDFTGHSCVNCRKMEASVWSDPKVLKRLKNDFIVVSLYVDDKTELPEEEKYVSEFNNSKVETIGDKWSDFQAIRFGANSQPYYVILDSDGNRLLPPRAFNLNIAEYIRFLDKGKDLYNNKK